MTADSMEEQIQELATLAQHRSEDQNKSIEEVVYNMTHNSYLMKHSTTDILQELNELQQTYPKEFYNGEANQHIMSYMGKEIEFEFWHDYPSLALAAGLEWAILQELGETVSA